MPQMYHDMERNQGSEQSQSNGRVEPIIKRITAIPDDLSTIQPMTSPKAEVVRETVSTPGDLEKERATKPIVAQSYGNIALPSLGDTEDFLKTCTLLNSLTNTEYNLMMPNHINHIKSCGRIVLPSVDVSEIMDPNFVKRGTPGTLTPMTP
eukprot:UN02533